MQKKITAIEPMMHRHIKVTFEDGTTEVLQRGVHLQRSGPVENTGTHASDPMPGEMWPPDNGSGDGLRHPNGLLRVIPEPFANSEPEQPEDVSTDEPAAEPVL